MASELNAFQDAFHFAGLSLSLRTRRNNFTVGANDWIACQAPPGGSYYLLAVMFEASVALSASGAQSAVANSSTLDEWFSQLEVSPGPATAARIFLKTRKAAEDFERLTLDTGIGNNTTSSVIKMGQTSTSLNLSTHIGSYPRTIPANFGASGTRTDTSEWWCPVGGPAASIRLTISAITAAYAANVTVTSYTIGFFEVYSVYSGTVAAFENTTATLAVGNNQDVMALNVYPAGLAVDLVDIVGESTTDVTAVYLTDAGGNYIINMDDTQSINSTYVYPRFATSVPNAGALVFFLHKTVPTSFRISLANSVALDFLWIATTGPQVAPLDNKANPPAPDETKRTGSTFPSSTGGQPASGSTPAGAGLTRSSTAPSGAKVGTPAWS